MNTPRIVAAMRAGEPAAIAALFDAYATDLFRYSWFLLRSRAAAQIAVRDAMVVAAAHAAALRDPGGLRQWLYALTRAECARRSPVPAASADEPPARPSQSDADGRVLAWNAVTSMDSASAEIIELTARHGMAVGDAAIVIGRGHDETAELLQTASDELVQFLGGYVVTRRVGFDCPELTAAIQGWAGVMTVPVRERVLAHTRSCAGCRAFLPRNVSPARVYELLPAPVPDEATRGAVLSWFADPRQAGYRNFAAARAAGAAQAIAAAISGAAPHEARVPHPHLAHRRMPGSKGRIATGLAAAGAAALGAAVFAFAGLPGPSPTPTVGNPPTAAAPSGPLVTGPLTRPGAIGAVRAGHAPRPRDPFASPPGQPAQALFLAARQPSRSPSASGGDGGKSPDPSGSSVSPTATPVPSWQRGPGGSPPPTTPPPSPTPPPSSPPPSSPPPSSPPPPSPLPSATSTPPPSPTQMPSATGSPTASPPPSSAVPGS